MPTMYPYHRTVSSPYLGVSKVIRAMTESELNWLAQAQLAKWDEQEKRRRAQKQREFERQAAKQEVESLKAQAEQDTRQAHERLAAFRSILSQSLATNLAIDWDQLLDRRTFSPFQFLLPKPNLDETRLRLLGPGPEEACVPSPLPEEPSVWEIFLPFLRRRRLEREEEANQEFEKAKKRVRQEHAQRLKQYRGREREVTEAYNSEVHKYNSRLREVKEKYARERAAFLAEQEAHNSAIVAFRSRYEKGSDDAIEQYVQMALERSPYPDGILNDPEVCFDEHSRILVTNFLLPGLADVPNVAEYRFVASRKEIKPVQLKQKEFEAFYDDVIHQVALRTMREAFTADYACHIEATVFNGWVHGIDTKTGRPFQSCILSCQAERKQFMDLDLAHVVPKDCIRGLKGITAGPLAMLAPVKPIMDLNREDGRFVDPKSVLDELRPDDNLAGMAWEDFEHLIRELFEKEFMKAGGEVKITQASRDRGVDAVAFDPDPIRGGKFVIQAKRYNMPVPVSAVRDLYGTMIAEGAAKGILVTTSYFGHDSREFAKDKPIALIDGENLVHMFQQHGYNMHIALLPKGDPRRGLG